MVNPEKQESMGRDSATFLDKETEVPSSSRDKGTTGKAQNLTKGWYGLGQPVKIQDGTWEGTVQDVPSHRIKWDRAEKYVLKQEKDVLKQEKDILKQKRMF
jgi:hypothetical protein